MKMRGTPDNKAVKASFVKSLYRFQVQKHVANQAVRSRSTQLSRALGEGRDDAMTESGGRTAKQVRLTREQPEQHPTHIERVSFAGATR
jgi:hypothetical protein